MQHNECWGTARFAPPENPALRLDFSTSPPGRWAEFVRPSVALMRQCAREPRARSRPDLCCSLPRKGAAFLRMRDLQAVHAIAQQRVLPGQEFLNGEAVAVAGFLQTQKSAVHGRNHLGLPARNPAARVGRRKIGECERRTVRTNHVRRKVALFSAHRFRLECCATRASGRSDLFPNTR